MSVRKILIVAKNELNTLFYSPIAWMMLALFAVLTGLDYVGQIDSALRSERLGGYHAGFLEYLSRRIIYEDRFSVFYKAIGNLYIFLPLLTMGLISRETSSGTIKLLYSSPLRIREIVLGKYLAIVSFALFMTAIAGLMIIGLCFSISNPDVPQLVASVTGLFLIMCCYAAIGLFISSLTSYQVVAAIATCVSIGLLKQANLYWQNVDVVRSITYYLNISDKSFNFLSGLVNLRDFAYFLILIGTFLAFTIIKLKSGTECISKARIGLRYGVVVLVAFLAGYITNRKDVNLYLDTTRGEDFTITKPTQDLLKQLDAHAFDVTAYVNVLDPYGKGMIPENQNYLDRVIFEQFYRFKPDIHVRYVYYYYADSTDYRFQQYPGKTLKDIAQHEAKQLKMKFANILTPEEVGRLIDVKAEGYQSFFHIQYGDKEMIIRVFRDDQVWPSEYEFAAAWQRQIMEPPKVLFLSGEQERDPFGKRSHNYSLSTSEKKMRYSLLNQGFDMDTVSLNNDVVPSGIATLVIADPRVPLKVDKTEKIKRYIDAGGNLLLLTEPDSWQNVKPILEKLGVTIKPGMIVQPSKDYSSDTVFPNLTDTAQNLSPFILRRIKRRKKLSGDTIVTLKMTTVSALNYKPVDGFTVEPLLTTDGKYSWNRIAPISKESLRDALVEAPGDEHGDFVTAVRMYRMVNGKEQRIIVASDADYLSADGLSNSEYGFEYQIFCYRYFSYGKFPTMTIRPESIDNSLKITIRGVFTQRILFCWILPGLLAITGVIILIRRKRK